MSFTEQYHHDSQNVSRTFSTQFWLRDLRVFSSCCIFLIVNKARIKYYKANALKRYLQIYLIKCKKIVQIA